MRWTLLLIACLLPVAHAQVVTPPPSMDLELAGYEGPVPLWNDTLEVAFRVTVDCSFFGADFADTYTLLFAYNHTENLQRLGGPEAETLPSGLCTTNSSWTSEYNLTLLVDREAVPGQDEPPIASLGFNVTMESTNPSTAPPADRIAAVFDWFIITEAVEEAVKQPPVPQEQTTPGPAAGLLFVAFMALAARRR